ncbi:MAG: energy transducer TonB [Rhodospirillales bacterium]|nr:TonB family protein [Rhodospirillales bacterium]MDE2199871.1 energy transducer TonB [Rhodospirillales bacterium]
MRRGFVFAVVLHLLAVAVVIALSRPFGAAPPPTADVPASIEVVLGSGNTGAPKPVPPRPAAPTRPTPPPPQPPAKPASPVAAPASAALPLPPSSPPPPPPPPARPAPSRPATAPTQPVKPVPPKHDASPPVRLGGGLGGPSDQIDPTRQLRAAKGDRGNLPPTYPLAAAMRNEHGSVRLRIHVDAGGNVVAVDVAKSSGYALLDRAARDQVASQWHFTPALRDGVPVGDVFELNINFVLQ